MLLLEGEGVSMSRRQARRGNRQRAKKLRYVVHVLVQRDQLARGHQSRLADHFGMSRQRVHQIVVEERRRHARRGEGMP